MKHILDTLRSAPHCLSPWAVKSAVGSARDAAREQPGAARRAEAFRECVSELFAPARGIDRATAEALAEQLVTACEESLSRGVDPLDLLVEVVA